MKEKFKKLWSDTPLRSAVITLSLSAAAIAIFVVGLFFIKAQGRTYMEEPSWERGIPITLLCHYTTTETYRTAADRYIVTYGVFKAEENDHDVGEYFIAKFSTDSFADIQNTEDGAALTLDFEQHYSEPLSLSLHGGYKIEDAYCSIENIPKTEALELTRTYAEKNH